MRHEQKIDTIQMPPNYRETIHGRCEAKILRNCVRTRIYLQSDTLGPSSIETNVLKYK